VLKEAESVSLKPNSMESPEGGFERRKRATTDSSIANYRRFFFDGLGYAPEIKFRTKTEEERKVKGREMKSNRGER
jgi:hypothetical protein